jgi:predicted naringenin-chalcone synthase
VTPQADLLAWDAWRRARYLGGDAEDALRKKIEDFRKETPLKEVAFRAHELPDFLHRDVDKMEIYHARRPAGADLGERNEFAARALKDIYENRLYPEGSTPPDALLAVSHTALFLPSAAQRLAHARGWSERSRIYHLNVSGCTATVQALRIALGIGPTDDRPAGWRVDVASTELFTLHALLNEENWQDINAVLAASYGDGLIRYSLTDKPVSAPHLRVLAMKEAVLTPVSENAGFFVDESRVSLELDMAHPFRVGRALKPFLNELFVLGGLDYAEEQGRLLLACYAGPPTMIGLFEGTLRLRTEQLRHTYAVAHERGSMGTATIPHIWAKILADPEVPAGTKILTIVSDPGLNLSACIVEKGGV